MRREQYVGVWLPKPVVTPNKQDPVELAESLTMAFLVLFERLTPVERAVFLLREVFEYSHGEIAKITESTEEACRQTLHRAKSSIQEAKSRFEPDLARAEELTKRFSEAVQAGRVEELMSLLHEDAVTYCGGRAPAALNPIYGRDRVARFLVGIAQKGGRDLDKRPAEINCQPGFIGVRDGEVRTVMVLDCVQGGIRSIYIVTNPDKLQSVAKETSLRCNHESTTWRSRPRR